MLCILAFIIFLIFFPILGFFPEYRRFFRRSWSCVFKKLTLKPCDINLGEEIKAKLVGKLIFKFPKVAKFIDKTFSFWAFLFVIVNIWTLITVALAGLNLFVYDTCEPTETEGCSLAGSSCQIGLDTLTFDEARREGRLLEWAWQPGETLLETLSLVPDRIKSWEAKDYLPNNPSYYTQENSEVAVEVIDPGCSSCRELWKNIKKSNFNDRYNLAYILYPIPENDNQHKTRFNNSNLLSATIETLKDYELENSETSPDWLFLDKLFTEIDDKGMGLQFKFSYVFEPNGQEARDETSRMLADLGFDSDTIQEINQRAESQKIEDELESQKELVEEEIKALKIPTIIFNGRRYNRVLDIETLNSR